MTMIDSSLKIEKRAGVLEVTLNRPKANAIDLATSRMMGEVFTRFRDDRDLRVALLTGAGDKLMEEARAMAHVLAAGPPLVQAAIKEIVREAEDMKFQDAMNRITKSQFASVETLYRSQDQLEGARAFAEKRDPVWKGK